MSLRVGVLTGGGDCPGLNAVIRAVTKSLIHHGQCEVLGIQDGFEGLMEDVPRVEPLDWQRVSGILHLGGRDAHDLRARCADASRLLGWPMPCARHDAETNDASPYPTPAFSLETFR